MLQIGILFFNLTERFAKENNLIYIKFHILSKIQNVVKRLTKTLVNFYTLYWLLPCLGDSVASVFPVGP